MLVVQRVAKPSTKRGKRALIKKAPKIIENAKQTLFIPGHTTSEMVSKFVRDIYLLKKPDAIMLNKKNAILPFEDATPVEKLCQKYDVSLFVFTSHNKKRPNNLVIGRLFDGHILDMYEFGVTNYSGFLLNNFMPSIGVKPCLLFLGEEFEQVHHLKRLKSLLIDALHRNESSLVQMNRMEYVVAFTIADDKILLRTYRIVLQNSGEKTPHVELESMGPFADLTLRRNVLASNDLFKRASSKPKLKGKKIQNVTLVLNWVVFI